MCSQQINCTSRNVPLDHELYDVQYEIMNALHEYLSDRGISQRAFARDLGVDPGTVSRMTRNEMTPSLELVARIERITRGRIKAVSWVSQKFGAAE